ncbi:MAG: HAD-IIB family hydrolase [Rhizobiaceae bacterium]|nr:HAD-IIB family hydrolase [Rhizobiaceae bacterium]
MNHIFLFDVDGTITPPRQSMNPQFAEFFDDFVQKHLVFLVSGSDYKKICKQVPPYILSHCAGVYGCSGAEYVEAGKTVFQNHHPFCQDLINDLTRFVEGSSYPRRHGKHLEHRPGMLNVSVVGRNANLEERRHYHAWDNNLRERETYVSKLMKKYPDYEASCGGEISIDIVPRGWNKSVVKKYILEKYPGSCLTFFGDRMGPQGNDRPLAEALNTPSRRHKAIEVENYKETWIHLRHLADDGMPKSAHLQNERLSLWGDMVSIH